MDQRELENLNEPPPDYAEAVGNSSRTPARPSAERAQPATPAAQASTSQRYPDEKRHPQSPYSGSYVPSTSSAPVASSSRSSGWIPDIWQWRADARTDAEVKKTVLSLIKDVITEPSRADTLPILQNCLTACRARNLSFEDLIQRPSIDRHTPLYWAILGSKKKGTTAADVESARGVIDFLVSFPLNDQTIVDARNACMLSSDNELFQRLRLSPGFARRTFAETVIRAGGTTVDTVRTEHVPNGSPGEFRISFTITNFISRMRVAKFVSVDFLARGRAWRLEFQVAPEYNGHMQNIQYTMQNIQPGTWCITLRLLRWSEPTFVTGRLEIPATTRTLSPKPVPSISIPLRPKRRAKLSCQTDADPESTDLILIRLDSVPLGSGLEFDDSPYVGPDGSLLVHGQFILEHVGSEPECIIA